MKMIVFKPFNWDHFLQQFSKWENHQGDLPQLPETFYITMQEQEYWVRPVFPVSHFQQSSKVAARNNIKVTAYIIQTQSLCPIIFTAGISSNKYAFSNIQWITLSLICSISSKFHKSFSHLKTFKRHHFLLQELSTPDQPSTLIKYSY